MPRTETLTVEGAREALDDFGGHIPLHVVITRQGRDEFYNIKEADLSLTTHPTTGESVVQIELGETPDLIH